jgi:N-methylhydantoinase A
MADAQTRFAIDVGGTFTDLVWWDAQSNEIRTDKALTSPDVVSGIRNVIEVGGLDPANASLFVHGTTLALNALLQGKGAPTGLITTQGFADVLEIAREDRPWMYDIMYVKPRPLVQRRFRLEVDERVNGQGEVLRPLDEDSVYRCVEVFKKNDLHSVAVCLLHSYANPEHEERVGEIVRAAYPDAYVTLSHRILRQHYEYERTVSAVMNSQVQPIMQTYLTELDADLERAEFKGTFLLLRSSGGAMTHREAREAPIYTLMSGPAGGVLGAVNLGRATDTPNIITADAGGTSFDVCLIADGEPQVSSHAAVDEYKLLLPILDIRSIGAGGGSIAWIDEAGAPQVGPQSAGSSPGPICYRGGGTKPTVTDAALVLGILNPDYFLGGRMSLDYEGSREAIETQIANPLGLSVHDAARGIVTIAETKMAGAIRQISVERGHDPREFTLLGFGGASPPFVCNLARALSMSRAMVPVSPANFSARGMLSADIVYDFTQTRLLTLDDIPVSEIEATMAEMIAKGRAALSGDGIDEAQHTMLCSLDMKYWGQGEHSVTVPLTNGSISEADRAKLTEAFHLGHERAYGHRMDSAVQIVNFRTRAMGTTAKPDMPEVSAGGASAEDALKGTREVYLESGTPPSDLPVYERSALRAGNAIEGPAIVEEATTTTLVGPGDSLTVDRLGHLVIDVATG